MTDLNEALEQICDIRRHVAESTQFQGWGPQTLLAAAGLAVLTGAAQARWVAQPGTHPVQYLALWLGTGVLAAAMILTEMSRRATRAHSGLPSEMMMTAVVQFLPAAGAGVAVPLVLLHAAPQVFWVVPGLWQICFGLGVFACCRHLPRAMWAAGAWFLAAGLVSLGLGEARAMVPAMMAGPFAAGMAYVAWVHARAQKARAL